MDIKPLGDRIVVQPLEAEEVTKGGIILPDTAKEKPHEGKIIAVGRGKVADNGQIQPLELKVEPPVVDIARSYRWKILIYTSPVIFMPLQQRTICWLRRSMPESITNPSSPMI